MPPRLPDRVELPAHGPGGGVERVDRAAAAGREPDRAGEDEPFPDDGRDVDELLGRAGEVPAPQLSARFGGERERVRVGRAVDPTAVHREPVRPFVQRAVAVGPPQLPGGALERVDVALEVLDVDRLVVRDRSRRERARVVRLAVGRPATESRARPTLPASMDAPAAARVPARSPFGSSQVPSVSRFRSRREDSPERPRRQACARIKALETGDTVPVVKSRLFALAAVSAVALVPAAQSAHQPQTTAPPPVSNIKVIITDSGIT